MANFPFEKFIVPDSKNDNKINNISVLETIKKTNFSNENDTLSAYKKPKIEKNLTSSLENKKPTFKLDLDGPNNLIDQIESKYISHINEQYTSTLVDKSKTFESFIVGHSNHLAYATAKIVAQQPSRPGQPSRYPSLFIHGSSGLGKSHLLHAVVNEINNRFPDLIVCLVTGREFMREMIKSIQEKKFHLFQKRFSDQLDVLIIDDIHELENKPGTQNEFFHIFNELHNKGKQLLFTSDKLPSEITGLEERIRTRLQWGLAVDIQKPDFETKAAILKQKSAQLDLYINEDILGLIASNSNSSIRELEGYLMKLSAYTDVMRSDIDLDTAKTLLGLKDKKANEKLTIEEVAKAVAKTLNIQLPDILSKSRSKDITQARQVAMFLAYSMCSSTLQQIGIYFGNRDHTTVLHAIKKIDAICNSDKDSAVFAVINKIKKEIS